MKFLIFLIFITGCGKNLNRFKNDFYYSSLQSEKSETLPQALSFKAHNHVINFNVSKKINGDFFEESKDLNRYYAHELSHIDPDSLYILKTTLPEDIDLYLHDEGKDYFIDQSNLKMNDHLLERMINHKSYLYLAFNNNSPRKESTVVKNFQTYDVTILGESLEDYLANYSFEIKPLNIDHLISDQGDNIESWWIKKDSLNHYKIAYSSTNDLKEVFSNHFQYKVHSLKRLNGQKVSLKLSNASFVKITGSKTLQKQTLHNFKKTYYTQIGELPYDCSFTEAKAQTTSTTVLSNSDIRDLLKLRSPQVNAWNYVDTLDLNLPSLSSGHFEVGLIHRKCITSMGPQVKKTTVNEEKELDLVIESYSRRE
ncbi:MAG: hypothetical protein WDA09_04235 [Bacteriovoracaceae bacterium]